MSTKILLLLGGAVVVAGAIAGGLYLAERNGTPTADSPTLSTGSRDLEGPPADPTHFGGELVAVSAESLTLKLQDESQKTFAVSAATKVFSPVSGAERGIGLSGLKAGMQVGLVSTADTQGALEIRVVPPLFLGKGGSYLMGEVVLRGEDSLTLSAYGAGEKTFSVGAQTKVISFAAAGELGMSYADLRPGDRVMVVGTTDAEMIQMTETRRAP